MVTEDKKKKLQKSYFDVLGLCCSSEVALIENILTPLEGVKEFSVIVPTRTLIVIHDNLLISRLEIVKALNQARLEANVRVYGDGKYQKKWPSPYAVASGALLLPSFLKYVYHPMRWFALGAVVAGILPILLKAIASIRNFRLDTNILVIIAVAGTIAMKDYTEAGTIVFLFTIADWLESRASHKANAVMSSLMSIAPQKAVIAESGEEVAVEEVKLNTIIAVKAGEVIPIDGIVVDGTCEVDEKTLTGESFLVPKQIDSIVWAGTINLNGYINVKTTALAEDCVVAKMVKLVEEAQNSKSRTQRFIDKCSQYYTPAVVIVSAGFAVIPLALRVHNRSHWFHMALVVLVSACPCAFILSTPVATFCALSKAATAGLLIKGGDYLETLSKIKVMAFDKTGTITSGEFVVADFESLCKDISLETLLYWVSSIESKSSHPMAAALVDYGRSLSIEPKPENVEEFQNFPGEGIQGKIDGQNISIGNRKIALRADSTTVPMLEADTGKGKTTGYVFSGAIPVGNFSLSDACRTGVAEAINELKSLSITTAMLTGDSQAAAMHVQEQLGHALGVVHAELLPEDKARIIENFKKEGPTAMIGDGINDAPALATADIGISMGISGSALATETGHVILMSNDLRKVPKAITLARKAHRKVIENVILSISTKTSILALAFAGHPLIWAAVLADVGTCLLVIFNSMLLLRKNDRHNEKWYKLHIHHSQKHCFSSKKTRKPPSCASGRVSDSAWGNKKCAVSNEPRSSNGLKKQGCSGSCASSLVSDNTCGNKKCAVSNELRSSNGLKNQDCSGSCASSLVSDNTCGNKKCAVSNEPRSSNGRKQQDCSGSCASSLVSDNTCRNKKCAVSNEPRSSNHLKQEDCSGCDAVNHDAQSNNPPNSTHKCTSSADEIVEEQDCQHTVTHGFHGNSNPSNRCPFDLEKGQKENVSHHCHEDETSQAKIVSSNCNYKNQHPDNFDKCCTMSGSGWRDCRDLEKREVDGCCKTYLKECCRYHGQFSIGSGGGLSEIVSVTESV